MEFSRPEYCGGQPLRSPGDLPNPGIEPRSPSLQAGSRSHSENHGPTALRLPVATLKNASHQERSEQHLLKAISDQTTATAIACLLLPRRLPGSLPLPSVPSQAGPALPPGTAPCPPETGWSRILGCRLRPLLPSQPPYGSQEFEAKDPV